MTNVIEYFNELSNARLALFYVLVDVYVADANFLIGRRLPLDVQEVFEIKYKIQKNYKQTATQTGL